MAKFIRDLKPENAGGDEHSCSTCCNYKQVGDYGLSCTDSEHCLEDHADSPNEENNCEGYEE